MYIHTNANSNNCAHTNITAFTKFTIIFQYKDYAPTSIKPYTTYLQYKTSNNIYWPPYKYLISKTSAMFEP